MFEKLNTRIEALSKRFYQLAETYSQATAETAEDLYQSMITNLFERQLADPSFCDQADSYLLDAGRKDVCFSKIWKQRTVDKYVFEAPELEDDLGEPEDYFETIAGPGINPEVAVIRLEEAVSMAKVIREQLSGRESEVLTLVANGVATKDIASKFGVSPAAVSVYKSRIIRKLQEAIA